MLNDYLVLRRTRQTKRELKKCKLGTCYLIASLDFEGHIKNVGTFSERNPTFMLSQVHLLLMKTKGKDYQKACDAMDRAVRVNPRFHWCQAWIGTDRETHMSKLALWERANKNELHVRDFKIESKFLVCLAETRALYSNMDIPFPVGNSDVGSHQDNQPLEMTEFAVIRYQLVNSDSRDVIEEVLTSDPISGDEVTNRFVTSKEAEEFLTFCSTQG